MAIGQAACLIMILLMVQGCFVSASSSPEKVVESSTDASRCGQPFDGGQIDEIDGLPHWCRVKIEQQGIFAGYSIRYPASWVVRPAGVDEPALRFDGVLVEGEPVVVFFQPVSVGPANGEGIINERPETWLARLYNTRSQEIIGSFDAASGRVTVTSHIEEVRRKRVGVLVNHHDLIMFYSFTYGEPPSTPQAKEVEEVIGQMLDHLVIEESK